MILLSLSFALQSITESAVDVPQYTISQLEQVFIYAQPS